MSTWAEYFWGTTNTTPPPNTSPVSPPPPPPPAVDGELVGLPEYDTFNALAPKFQWTPELDPNHIFSEELELVDQLRQTVPAAEKWPARYLLIFLFARRHSVSHAAKLLSKHIQWLSSMGFSEVDEENPYPFTPEQLTESERQYAIFGGHTLYRHGLVDKHDRLLQYIRMRCWFSGRIEMKKYIATVLWWYYYTFQFVPLKVHRNGMTVVVDMTNMGWANVDLSTDVQRFISTALTGLPGRMRQCWVVNPNWLLSTAWAFLRLILSSKILSRMQPVSQDVLLREIEKENIPKDLGGEWEPDLVTEWYEKVFELDQKARGEKEGKGDDLVLKTSEGRESGDEVGIKDEIKKEEVEEGEKFDQQKEKETEEKENLAILSN